MSGCIIGFYGFQRSGKTLMAYLIAEKYRKKGCKVYSNIDCPDFIKINSLTDLPFDYKPKVLFLDEVYYFLDSRNWKSNTNTSIFFNTIGKQNILLLMTAISPDMVEMRLRNQHNYLFMVKSDKEHIYYKVFDVVRKKSKVYSLKKSDKLFSSLKYNTLQVPDLVDCSLRSFADVVKKNNEVRLWTFNDGKS